MLLCTTQATEKFLVVAQVAKSSILLFYSAAKPPKKFLFAQTEHWELSSFTNIVAKVTTLTANWKVTSQTISGDFAKVSNFTELKYFTIALSVFLVADSQI